MLREFQSIEMALFKGKSRGAPRPPLLKKILRASPGTDLTTMCSLADCGNTVLRIGWQVSLALDRLLLLFFPQAFME
jgi:hypothetical protein